MVKKTVLVCPMDWGLGHASRCIPVINALMNAGCRVVVASSGPGADLIMNEYKTGRPEIIPFPGFTVSYSRRFLFLRLAFQIPEFLYHIRKEKKMLKELVIKVRPDLIISDNRYGLVHDSVPSVLITHQLSPSLPLFFKLLEKPLAMIIRKWASQFDECWIPDNQSAAAAGELIAEWDRLPRVFFTGWLSRFLPGIAGRAEGGGSPVNPPVLTEGAGWRYKVMFILSGPEPQRSMLEKMIIGGCARTGIRALLVRGVPGITPEREMNGALEVVSFLESRAMLQAIGDSRFIVCRSGYSSVMDMLVLGKKAVLIPTPGQSEQEYLGRWLEERGWFPMVKQRDFSVEVVLEREILYNRDFGIPLFDHDRMGKLLQERVNTILSRLP